MHETNALGLVGFGRVWHFAFLGPVEEIPLPPMEARLFGVVGSGGGLLRRGLPGGLGGNLLGLVVLIISNEEASGGTVRAGDDLVELVGRIVDKIDGLVVLVRGDGRVLTLEDLGDVHRVGDT